MANSTAEGLTAAATDTGLHLCVSRQLHAAVLSESDARTRAARTWHGTIKFSKKIIKNESNP